MIAKSDPTSDQPHVQFAAGMGSGWRRFDFDNPLTDNLRPYAAHGTILVDVDAEFRLGWITSALSRFSLFGEFKLALPFASLAPDDTEVATSWLRREVGARVRFPSGSVVVGIEGAEGGSSFQFEDEMTIVEGQVPEASYEYLRVGAWVGTEGANALGVGADGIVVMSVKGLAQEFDSATVFGFRVRTWYRRMLFKGVDLGISGSFTQLNYSLTYTEDDDYQADGGTDRMFDVSLSAGYSF